MLHSSDIVCYNHLQVAFHSDDQSAKVKDSDLLSVDSRVLKHVMKGQVLHKKLCTTLQTVLLYKMFIFFQFSFSEKRSVYDFPKFVFLCKIVR